jgi:glycosyltransferase involved in cell wall biosynthesis
VAVAHSSSVAQAVEQRWKPPAGRLVTFPLAVDTERFRPREHGHRREWRQRHQIPEEAVLVVSVGRFVPSKRFESLVEALAGSRTPANLLLIGGGPLEPAMRASIRALDLDGRVWMPGPLYDAELADALGAADILCSPSEYEGFGLTLIEGMACGLPVVARAVGGVTDVVEDGVTGHLLASSAPDVWASAIDRLAHDADERRRLGAAGRARAVADFSLDHFVGSFTRLYEQAARRSASSAGGRSPERPGR